ncbi:RnfABCDGE type electron transport complex subunit D [Petroclostridium sp. X23]|uniref:RnfABCDGE type electron transport complex subunit D n=1 Tax=Petroclostridium sp. X23 TaxID=3045146 RepID=UPI0024ACCD1F|nr:RnfABCDGE type electron transport complex subunit D [Petroclostridium sp. X23]WHH59993.1 RnfABCDGE type electron transport complex subunit D [Petroclostridium sp. X23]
MEQLIVSSSPHISHGDSVPGIMRGVLLALIPVIFASIYFFGIRAAYVLVVCIIVSVLSEYVFQTIRKRPLTISDGSAALTGVLLALTLPSTIPLWMAAVGSIVAIVLGKQAFGGLGSNVFNPALVGRAFLLISFPVAMTTWVGVDGVTSATPLNLLKMQGQATDYLRLVLGNVGGSLGETSAIAVLIGGLYLLYKNYIDWRIPFSFIGTSLIVSLIAGQDPIFHLLSGGLLLGAFFMATDMVTTPITRTGKWIFGIVGGLLVAVIRIYGGYPEGVMFAILLMNSVTPVINRYTNPRMYGSVKANA